MRFTSFSFVLPALLLLSTFTSAHPSRIVRRDGASGLLDALNSKGDFSTLTGWLKDNPELIKTVMSSNGPKTLFAPTNFAAAPLPDNVRNNKDRLQAALLYHVINGQIDLSDLSSEKNIHTVGHSLLTSSVYVNLPGGNGLPVAMQPGQLVEGSNNDDFDGDSFKYNSDGLDLTIQPIKRMLSVPGNITFTVGYHGGHDRIVELVRSVGGLGQTIDNMKGVTIFAPTDAALNQFLGTNGSTANVNQETISTVIMQHVIANRVVFSPLLADQGSIINAAGQDLVYDQSKNVVTVGNWSAQVLQTDLMATGGVVHLIDSVLGSTTLNQNRASEAANSAKASARSGISGAVTSDNSATSQGNSVPGPDTNNQGTGYKNATSNANDGSDSGSGSGGNGNGNGNGGRINSNGNGVNDNSSTNSKVLVSSSALVGIVSMFGLVLVL